MEPLVRARTLSGFTETVEALGADSDQVLTDAGLNASVMANPKAWISFRKVLLAYEIAAQSTGRPSFGLQLAMHRDLSFLGPLILIFKYSDTLESGLKSGVKYISVQNTGFQVMLSTNKESACWIIKMPDSLRDMSNQWIEESLLTALKMLRIFLGDAYMPTGITLRHQPESEIQRFEQYFGKNVEFSSANDALVIDRASLDVPNPMGDQETFDFLSGYLDSRVQKRGDDIVGSVQALLRNLIPTGKYSIDVVADQLGMHRRTLQRRLEATGPRYADVLEQCRSEMAIDYLATSNLPMVNLAYMLGYADQSAFNHAFRRWHGVSPREWQQRNLETGV